MPILAYAGGKTKLLPDLLARMPVTFNRYFEPFIGGGALFFHLAPVAAIIGDYNDDLMKMYQTVSEDPDGVMRKLDGHCKKHDDKEYYKKVRAKWNKWAHADPVSRAAEFIYLNKAGYNGLHRVNAKGELNTPRGDRKASGIYDREQVLFVADILGRTFMHSGDYRKTTAKARKGDFCYMDSPYDGTFTAYTNSPFGKEQQVELAAHAKALHEKGVKVMLSNSDTPFIRDLYKAFEIDTVKCARNVSCDGKKRGKVNELIIRTYT